MAKKTNKKEVSRSSISGRFVTKDYALRHPKTTEIEHVDKPKRRKTKKR